MFECAVCFERDISEIGELPCLHSYCITCILKWAREKENSCPLCKDRFRTITKKRLAPSADDVDEGPRKRHKGDILGIIPIKTLNQADARTRTVERTTTSNLEVSGPGIYAFLAMGFGREDLAVQVARIQAQLQAQTQRMVRTGLLVQSTAGAQSGPASVIPGNQHSALRDQSARRARRRARRRGAAAASSGAAAIVAPAAATAASTTAAAAPAAASVLQRRAPAVAATAAGASSAPAQGHVVPAQRNTALAQRNLVPAQRSPAPAQRHTAPAQRGSSRQARSNPAASPAEVIELLSSSEDDNQSGDSPSARTRARTRGQYPRPGPAGPPPGVPTTAWRSPGAVPAPGSSRATLGRTGVAPGPPGELIIPVPVNIAAPAQVPAPPRHRSSSSSSSATATPPARSAVHIPAHLSTPPGLPVSPRFSPFARQVAPGSRSERQAVSQTQGQTQGQVDALRRSPRVAPGSGGGRSLASPGTRRSPRAPPSMVRVPASAGSQ